MTPNRRETGPRGAHTSHTAGEKAWLQPRWPSNALTTPLPARSRIKRATDTIGTADGSAAAPVDQIGFEAAQHAACRRHLQPISVLTSSWRTNEINNLP